VPREGEGPRFDVFIERPTDTSPEGRERLIRAMAARFGIDDKLLRGPLSTGRRLRAKANVAEPAAAKMARELEALGAIVTISRHSGSGPRPSQELPAARPAPAPRPPSDSFAPMPSLTLATLDGEEVGAAPPPPLSEELAAPPPPVPRPPSGPRPAVAAPAAADAFAPPDAEKELPLELAVQPSRGGTLAALADAPPPAPSRISGSVERRLSTRSLPAAPVDEPPPLAPRPGLIELATRDPRGRLAAGLALGLAAGFLPAHVYASFAEERLDEIGQALAREPAPHTEAEYQLLMQQFDLAEARSRRVKARIVVVTGALWLLAGAGAAYGYWRIMEARTPRARAGA
jgi:hypothetical protein